MSDVKQTTFPFQVMSICLFCRRPLHVVVYFGGEYCRNCGRSTGEPCCEGEQQFSPVDFATYVSVSALLELSGVDDDHT